MAASRVTLAAALGVCLPALAAGVALNRPAPEAPLPEGGETTDCTDSLAQLCSSARRASAGDCLVCAGVHQPELQRVNCNNPTIGAWCSGAAPAPDASRDLWPMFMRTPSHDASSAAAATNPAALGSGDGPPIKAAWVYNMSRVVSSSPTLIGDVVLAASGCGPHACAGGDIVALYRSSGAVKWSTPLGSGVAYSSPMPSKDQTLVYIGTDDGKVVAVSVETGKIVHSFQTGDTVSSTPCVAPGDGSVYVGSYDKNLYKLDAQLNLVWKFATTGQVWSSPAISADGTMVVVGSVDKGIYSVHADSGKQIWMHNTTGRIKSSPILNGKQVLIGNFEDKCLRALDAATGKEIWRFTSQDFIFSSPAVAVAKDGTEMVVLTGSDSFVYGIKRESGQQVWKFKTGSYIDASPAIAGGKAVVALDDGVLYVIDVSSGALVSKFSDMAGSESSAAIGDDAIYLGSSDGGVRKLVNDWL